MNAYLDSQPMLPECEYESPFTTYAVCVLAVLFVVMLNVLAFLV